MSRSVLSLHDLLTSTDPVVRKLAEEWSKSAIEKAFDRILTASYYGRNDGRLTFDAWRSFKAKVVIDNAVEEVRRGESVGVGHDQQAVQEHGDRTLAEPQ